MKMAKMKRGSINKACYLVIALLLVITAGCAATGDGTSKQPSAAGSDRVAVPPPKYIPADVTCGKCGMYPVKYPRWQSQIIFSDGSMTPFDGCKCMFNFLYGMEKFDKTHSREDVAVAWVKDFNSGAWINALDAYFVAGSNMMGPMGKELIPFAENDAAMKFHREQGGSVMRYGEITPDVLKTLGMGGMKMGHGDKGMKM